MKLQWFCSFSSLYIFVLPCQHNMPVKPCCSYIQRWRIVQCFLVLFWVFFLRKKKVFHCTEAGCAASYHTVVLQPLQTFSSGAFYHQEVERNWQNLDWREFSHSNYVLSATTQNLRGSQNPLNHIFICRKKLSNALICQTQSYSPLHKLLDLNNWSKMDKSWPKPQCIKLYSWHLMFFRSVQISQ